MKTVLLGLLVMTIALAYGARPAMAAAEVAGTNAGGAVMAQAEGADSEEDDVLEVQLFVLSAVILTVFIGGTGAYFLRKRLGLTAYTPPADSGHH